MIEIRIMPTCENVIGHLSLLVICLGVKTIGNYSSIGQPIFSVDCSLCSHLFSGEGQEKPERHVSSATYLSHKCHTAIFGHKCQH